MQKERNLSVKKENDFLWVLLPDSIGVDNCNEIQREIELNLSSQKNKVVLDLSNTTMMYSSGLGLLIRLRKVIMESDGALYFVNVSKKIRNYFTELNLNRVFNIYATDVEFDLSKDEIWNKKLTEEDNGFIFVAQVEKGIYRLTFSGRMSASNDLSSANEFLPVKDVECFVLNLENLDLFDTYGSQLFSDLIQRIHTFGGKCIAYGASDIIRNISELYPTYSFIKFYETEKEAIESIKK